MFFKIFAHNQYVPPLHNTGKTDIFNQRASINIIGQTYYKENGYTYAVLEISVGIEQTPSGSIRHTYFGQPLGGAIQIYTHPQVYEAIQGFAYCNGSLKKQRKCKIFIDANSLSNFKQKAYAMLEKENEPEHRKNIETDITHKLQQEFDTALKYQIRGNEFTLKTLGIFDTLQIADHENAAATYSVNKVQQVTLISQELVATIRQTTSQLNRDKLTEKAFLHARTRQLRDRVLNGKASTIVAIPLDKLQAAFTVTKKTDDSFNYNGIAMSYKVGRLYCSEYARFLP